MIWCSQWQLNRLFMAKHIYIDGTFSYVPGNYEQILTIMGDDHPNTGYAIPLMYAVINSKDEQAYVKLLTDVKTILENYTVQHKSDLKKRSAIVNFSFASCTIDFEDGLINAVAKVFPNVDRVYFYFLSNKHFKDGHGSQNYVRKK